MGTVVAARQAMVTLLQVLCWFWVNWWRGVLVKRKREASAFQPGISRVRCAADSLFMLGDGSGGAVVNVLHQGDWWESGTVRFDRGRLTPEADDNPRHWRAAQ